MIVNVNKASGEVVDIGQTYDERFFDNIAVADGTIPLGDPPRWYKRDQNGAIVKRIAAEIEQLTPAEKIKRIKQEWAADLAPLLTAIQGLPDANPAKALLLNLLKLMRKLAALAALE